MWQSFFIIFKSKNDDFFLPKILFTHLSDLHSILYLFW